MPPVDDTVIVEDAPKQQQQQQEKPAPQKPSKPAEKPKQQPKQEPKQQPKQKPSDGYTRQKGVPGTFPKTKADQNGDGIDDAFQGEGMTIITGPTDYTIDPDFDYNLH